jgi:hypothetical protein
VPATGAAIKLKRSGAPVALVPPEFATVTSTMPVPAGEVAVIVVALTTVNAAAAVDPKLTAVARAKPVPVIVTAVPPAVEPMAGVIAVTVGAEFVG